ncbi:MAG: hypothetical protein Q7R92_05890 [bacterium]|nr:hypothetical protein [bacterium]
MPLTLFLGLLFYIGIGGLDYYKWVKTKNAIAGGGYTNLYAGTFGAVTPGCTYTQKGCTCDLCNDCGCNTYSQAMIIMGQEVNMGAINLCVNDSVQVKGAPLIASAGKQFMAGSLTGKCLTANAVLATPSMAASNFEKILALIDNYIIAGFKR